MKLKKTVALLATAAIAVSALAGTTAFAGKNAAAESGIRYTSSVKTTGKAPKYVFLFIGDGMSYPQIQTASYYLGALQEDYPTYSKNPTGILAGGEALSFMNFPVAGSATTYDATSFDPDSASTATSIATGYKTHSGSINVDPETKTIAYETIAEKLKDQKDYRIGIVTSVNLNHATPAAFYAHQASRNSYYDIGLELVESDFDYFAGGGLLKPDGDGTQENLYDLARAAGYDVIFTQEEAEQLEAGDKALVIGETLADASALSYDGDRSVGEWGLSDYVRKGIDVLDNKNGFFMMVEGGKIDWACHANDAGSTVGDTLALSRAVDTAIEFYNEHPNDTLILVTGDHETGGLTIGYAGTDYGTYLENLENQKISYAKFDSDYVAGYKETGASFEQVLADVEKLFGLRAEAGADGNGKLVLTGYEMDLLKAAYDKTMSGEAVDKTNQAEYVLYGTYEPLTVTITHILNNKSGISFTSYSHTGIPVPVFALGRGQELFTGYYDNTDIYNSMARLLRVK